MSTSKRTDVARRAAQALLLSTGAVGALGEGSDRYDASRHALYATQRLRLRRQRATQGDAATRAEGLWLQREKPTFPYVVALSPADNPARVDKLLGASERVVGSPRETTSATLDALVEPVDAPLDALAQRVASRWRGFKRKLRGDVPAAFDDAQQRALERRLAVLLTALRAAHKDETEEANEEAHEDVKQPSEAEASEEEAPSEAESAPTVSHSDAKWVFYLRDFDAWDDASATAWLQWVHEVTSAALAHVVLPTGAPVTPAVMRDWQRVHKVPDADFVAILLRTATRACDPSAAEDKLRLLSGQHGLDLRGLENEKTEDDDAAAFAPPAPPTEAQLIVETVGNWWRDLEMVCRALEIRGLSQLASDDERLVLVQQVCEEYEREAMIHVMATLGIHDWKDTNDLPAINSIDDEHRDNRISALQAWKCLEVVTGVGDDAQILASPQKILQRESGKPHLCAHPVEALLPFNQRVHGEAKFLELVEQGILCLRPKNDVEIGVLPCDTKALVAPCWVEARPLIKRAFEKLWRDDTHYQKILELERFEDNHKLSEEVALYEQEIEERRKVFDAQTREFIMLQHTMKKHEVAQRKAELALFELEIQSKLVYLERLRGLLDY